MNTGPKTHLIPSYWSPEQALAVYEFLQHLTELVWDRYQFHIIDLIGVLNEHDDRPTPPLIDSSQIDLFAPDNARLEPDDDLPF